MQKEYRFQKGTNTEFDQVGKLVFMKGVSLISILNP